MTTRVLKDDPRIDLVVDLLLGHPQGLTREKIAPILADWSDWALREILRLGRTTGRLAKVHFGTSEVRWTAARHKKALARKALAQSRHLAELRRQRRAAGLKACRKTYSPRGFNLDDVPDLEVVHRRVSTWAPMAAAPGPTSIFNLGTHHA